MFGTKCLALVVQLCKGAKCHRMVCFEMVHLRLCQFHLNFFKKRGWEGEAENSFNRRVRMAAVAHIPASP